MTVCVRTLPVAKIIYSPMKERLVKSQLERIQNETDVEYNEGICLEVLWIPRSRLPVSGPNFKAGTSRIQRRATNHSTAKVGCLWFCFFRQLFVVCNCASRSSISTNTSCFLGHQCDFIRLTQTASIPTWHRHSGATACSDVMTYHQ
jgi:hypothetical protein